MRGAARESVAVLGTATAHRARILPAVRHELEGWHRVADEIPDLTLRRAALAALTEKAANPEATAVLATLAPWRARAAVIRASTALQVAIDYLDSLGEQPGPDPLGDGLALHRSLGVALSPGAEPADWYAQHPHGEDGGYLDRLVAACQEALVDLPAPAAVMAVARRAAERCGEGQSRTHAAAQGDVEQLRAWASSLGAPEAFTWWEVAAGASSSVAAHALIAAAADPSSTGAEATAIDAAYFPPIGALTVLLDDLVDRDADRASGDHNYMGYYGEDAAERLALIARAGREATAGLRHPARHSAILSGVVAYYFSDPGATRAFAAPARAQILRAAGPTARPLTTLLGLQRRD